VSQWAPAPRHVRAAARRIVQVYVELIRNIVQLFFIFFGLPAAG
jgi:ABC-type amino acid transport system permease subunit